MKPSGVGAALGAAVLLGVSAPLAKLLVGATGPLMLAGLLYLGAGLGLALVALPVPRRSRDTVPREAPLQGADVLPLLGVIAAGGVAAPVLMLFGLARVLSGQGSSAARRVM